MKYGRLLLVVALLATASAFVMQSYDLTANIDPKGTFTLANHANALDSGIRVDRAGYQCVSLVAASAKVQNDAAHLIDYLVLIDSTTGVQAWNLVDSIPVDSVDNKSYKLGYTGTKRWIRTVYRASGAAADTFDTKAAFILGCKRSR